MGRNKRFHKRFAPSWMNVRRPSVAGDTEMIANSMANDYIQTDIAGYVQNKTAWRNEYFKPLAELITAGKSHWEAFDKKDIQIRMYGETAIVIGDKVKKDASNKNISKKPAVPVDLAARRSTCK
jgi:hypothetical protein